MAINVFTAVRNIGFVAKLFTAAKLNLDQFIEAGDESALAAHIEAQRAPAVAATTATVTVDNTAINTAFLAEAGIKIGAGQTPAQALASHVATANLAASQVSTFATTFTAAGIKVSGDSKPAQIIEAVEARISTRAGEELAKRGVGSAFVADTPVIDPAKAPKDAKSASLEGLSKTEAAYAAKYKF